MLGSSVFCRRDACNYSGGSWESQKWLAPSSSNNMLLCCCIALLLCYLFLLILFIVTNAMDLLNNSKGPGASLYYLSIKFLACRL